MDDDFDDIEVPEKSNRISGTHLHEAIANGDFEAFEQLVKDGAPMEVRNCHGLTPLQVVCAKKEHEMASSLLRAGCQANAKSSSGGKTALALAAFVGHFEIFESLINHGADIDCKDDHGWTILHEAVLGNSVDIVEHVCKIRPKMKYTECTNGRTPLHLAAFCNSSEELLKGMLTPEDTMLLSKYKDANGRTITQMASLHSQHDWGAILSEET